MNLLGVSTLTDPGRNSTLPMQAGLGDFRAPPMYALRLSSVLSVSLPTFSLEDAGYKGQRGLGAGQLEELLIWFPR